VEIPPAQCQKICSGHIPPPPPQLCPVNQSVCHSLSSGGFACCSAAEICMSGVCCPQSQACGYLCCPQGTTCCNNGTGGAACCSPGQTCCNGTCCPAGQACCGGACCPAGNCSNGCCLVNPIGPLTSNTNYLLKSGCQPIEGLNVALQASPTQALVANNGFTMQLNAYNPASPNISWMQYVIKVSGNSASASIQYWDISLFNKCAASCMGSLTCIVASCTGPTIWFPLPSVQTPFVQIPLPKPLPSNTLPAGWTLGIALDYNGGNVSGATFTVQDNASPPNVYSVPIAVPVSLQLPIVAFQVDVVGPGGLVPATTFSPGAGSITYQANGQLCIEGGLPDACSNTVGSIPTNETSNAQYGPVSACCGSSLTQTLSTP